MEYERIKRFCSNGRSELEGVTGNDKILYLYLDWIEVDGSSQLQQGGRVFLNPNNCSPPAELVTSVKNPSF